MLKVLCLGGVTLDVLVTIEAEAQLLPGQKQEVSHIELAAGGGAMNAATVFNRLGAQVGIHCAIGRDEAGTFMLRTLTQSNVSTADVEVVDDTPTGKAVVTIPRSGDASVMAARGANLRLHADSISTKSADLLYVTAAPQAAYRAIAQRLADAARAFGFVAFNPGIGQIIADFAQCEPIIAECDLLVVNKNEARQLAQQMDLPCTGLPIMDICRGLGRRCQGFVCITDGEHGAWLTGDTGLFYQPAFEQRRPAYQSCTLGAGDTFGATLAYMLRMRESPEAALQLAARNAAATMTALDAHSGALSIVDLKG